MPENIFQKGYCTFVNDYHYWVTCHCKGLVHIRQITLRISNNGVITFESSQFNGGFYQSLTLIVKGFKYYVSWTLCVIKLFKNFDIDKHWYSIGKDLKHNFFQLCNFFG